MSIGLDVVGFTWGRVQRLHDVNPTVHWQPREDEGLVPAGRVVRTVVRKDANTADFAAVVRAVAKTISTRP